MNARTRQELIDAKLAGEDIRWLFFWGHTPKNPAVADKSCLSQWFPAAFEHDGRRYASAEHWMMVGKARLFGDEEALERMLLAKSPAQAKKIGREVRHFDADAWSAASFEIVVQGSVHKFAQNPELLDFLQRAGRKVLVEAAPRDRIWGIGLGQNNELAQNPARWRGENKLGFALMEARERLSVMPGIGWKRPA